MKGCCSWDGHETWYRVVGELDPDSPQTPVVICHGGPGRRARLLRADRRAEPVRPRLRPLRPARLRQEPAPARRAGRVLDAAALQGRARRADARTSASPTGMPSSGSRGAACSRWSTRSTTRRACAGSSSPTRRRACRCGSRRRTGCGADLPADVQETLTRHEQDGTTDDPEYEAAVRVFYDRHLCRVPWPDCVQRSFDQMDADPTVYHTMNGPSEFHVIGSLKTWDITDRLHEITTPDAARLRPPRRGDAADRRADPRAHPRRASGRSSRSRATCRTSRSRRRSSSASRSFLRTID